MTRDGSYRHEDALSFLNDGGSLSDKLCRAHATLKMQLPYIARIALALYDPETETLKTYLHSSGDDAPLDAYEATMAQAPSLREILARGRPRGDGALASGLSIHCEGCSDTRLRTRS